MGVNWEFAWMAHFQVAVTGALIPRSTSSFRESFLPAICSEELEKLRVREVSKNSPSDAFCSQIFGSQSSPAC